MPRGIPELRDPLWLREQYVAKGRSAESIAEEIDCTFASVYRRMKQFGIDVRQTSSHPPELDDAEWLREQYVVQSRTLPEMASMIGCSQMPIHKALKRAGIPRRTPGQQRSSVQRKDAKYSWGPNGERRGTYHSGYVLIHVPDWPSANARGMVPEHRYVAAQKIGRQLKPGEVVHHLNGVRQDNRPENLEVFPSNSAHRKHHKELERAQSQRG